MQSPPTRAGRTLSPPGRRPRRELCAGSLPSGVPGDNWPLMKQSQTQQLEEMHATLVRATASLQKLDVIETDRLLALLRGMVEGALAEAQHGRWWR
jgi:hypothetical protein